VRLHLQHQLRQLRRQRGQRLRDQPHQRVANCGACGSACPARPNASSTCAGSACGITCNGGFGDCNSNAVDGCEANFSSNATHCGRCNNPCVFANASGTCSGGGCALGACNSGFSNCDGNASNGCETAGACVFSSCNAVPRSFPSGVYTLNAGGSNWQAYCDMTSDGGGWTLVLKARGNDGNFLYTSALWTNTTLVNETSTDLSQNSAKFRGFFTLPFTAMRLGMVDGATRYITVAASGTSLRDVLSGGYRATAAGRNAWRSLVANPSLQPNCNREGFNVDGGDYQRVRIGIIANQENDCNSPDSRIGFGGQNNLCGAGGDNAVGNVASCAAENGDRNSYLFGYIFVR
jgi:hypothetical protein